MLLSATRPFYTLCAAGPLADCDPRFFCGNVWPTSHPHKDAARRAMPSIKSIIAAPTTSPLCSSTASRKESRCLLRPPPPLLIPPPPLLLLLWSPPVSLGRRKLLLLRRRSAACEAAVHRRCTDAHIARTRDETCPAKDDEGAAFGGDEDEAGSSSSPSHRGDWCWLSDTSELEGLRTNGWTPHSCRNKASCTPSVTRSKRWLPPCSTALCDM
jgi:hypothetical protein